MSLTFISSLIVAVIVFSARAGAETNSFVGSNPEANLQRNAVMLSLVEFSKTETPFSLVSKSIEPFGWMSHTQLYKYEENRIEEFNSVARGFRQLDPQEQLDYLASGLLPYNYFSLDINEMVFETQATFSPMTDWLAPDINEYARQIHSMLELYKLDASQRISNEGLKVLDSLIEKAQLVVEIVDASPEEQGQGYLKPNHIVPQTPYSQYLNEVVTLIRKSLVQDSCKVPASFKAGFHEDLVEERLKTAVDVPVPDLFESLKEAKVAEERFIGLLMEIEKQWYELVEAESLNEVEFSGHLPLHSKKVASGLHMLVATLKNYADAAKANFREDAQVLNQILQDIESGNLCFPR